MKKVMGLVIVMIVILGATWVWGYYSNKKVEVNQVEVLKELTVEDICSLIEKKNPRVDPELRKIIAETILKKAKEYDVDPALVVSIIDAESGWNQYRSSDAQCIGLMQINPAAHKDLIKEKGITWNKLFHIGPNIDLGCRILKDNIDRFDSVQMVLSGYNAGPTVTEKKGKIPYTETRSYVKNVLAVYGELMIDLRKDV